MRFTRYALGAYEVVAELGAGGMGEVYRARDTTLGREVAIKLVNPSFCGDPDSLSRLRREARALASLNHPHVATVHELAEFDGFCGLVMSWLRARHSPRCRASAVAVAEATASGCRLRPRSRPRTSGTSSTAISSPPTSWSPPTEPSRCSTSAWRNPRRAESDPTRAFTLYWNRRRARDRAAT